MHLKTLSDGLTPGSSAIVAVLEYIWVERVRREMERAGADLLTEGLRADIAAQLEAGHDVAYGELADREGFAAGRVAVGNTDIEGGYVIADKCGSDREPVCRHRGRICRGIRRKKIARVSPWKVLPAPSQMSRRQNPKTPSLKHRRSRFSL